MTLVRPDHRETDRQVHIGKKLSHPGPEVVDAMVCIWSMIAARRENVVYHLCLQFLFLVCMYIEYFADVK
jgi:hypothetical protein